MNIIPEIINLTEYWWS